MRRTLIAALSGAALLAAAGTAGAVPVSLWTTTFGSTSTDHVRKLKTLDDGSTLVTGTFAGTVTFGSTTLVSAGTTDAFFARMNPDGTWAWATRAGGGGDDQGRDITVGTDGTVVFTGYINQQGITTPSPTFGATTVPARGKADFFTTALDPDTGAFRWTRLDGGTQNDYAYCVRAMPDGSYLTAGSYQGTMTVDGTTLPTSRGAGDLFAMRVNGDGTLRWIRYLGGSASWDDLFGLTVLSDGSFAATGYVDAVADFANGDRITPLGAQDIIVLKADASGNVEWVRRGGGAAGDDFGMSISTYYDDSLLVGGYYRGTGDIAGTPVSGRGGQDAFIARVTPQGGVRWVRTWGGPGDESLWQVHAAVDDTAWVAGFYGNNADLDGTTLTSNGGADGMAVQIDGDGRVMWHTTRGGAQDDAINSIGIGANGRVSFGGRFKATVAFSGRTVTSAGDFDGFVDSLQAEAPVAPPSRDDPAPSDPAPTPTPAAEPVGQPVAEPTTALTAAAPATTLTGTVRVRRGLVTTTGPMPAGATDVVQGAVRAVPAAGATQLTRWRSSMAYPCTITGIGAHRRYHCARTLTPGTWRLSTEARVGTTLLGTMVRRVTVRAVRAPAVAG